MHNTTIHDFLVHLAVERGLSANTVSSYRTDLNKFSTFLESRSKNIMAAARTDLLDFLHVLKESGHRVSTVQRILSAVKGIYRYLLARGTLGQDPTERPPEKNI